MIVISAGMSKSGSTYLSEMIKAVLTEVKYKSGVNILSVRDIDPDVIENDWEFYLPLGSDLDEYITAAISRTEYEGCISFCKTHELPTEVVVDQAAKGCLNSFHTFRHPEEIALSLIDQSRKNADLEHCIITDTVESIYFGIDHYEGWMQVPHSIGFLYDDLITDPKSVMSVIIGKLGVSELIDDIDRLAELAKSKAIQTEQYNRAIVDRHLDEFPEEDRHAFDSLFGEFTEDINSMKRLRQTKS